MRTNPGKQAVESLHSLRSELESDIACRSCSSLSRGRELHHGNTVKPSKMVQASPRNARDKPWASQLAAKQNCPVLDLGSGKRL